MKLYTLKRSQKLPFPIEKVFSFFDRPENLEKMTPSLLKFQMLTPPPVKMHVGTVIDYTLKVWSIPIRWTSLITEYNPPHSFIDLQLKGPYAYWHHEHKFEADGDQTIMHDEVTYALPFGFLGQLFHSLKVKSDLNKIFDFREKEILKHLS